MGVLLVALGVYIGLLINSALRTQDALNAAIAKSAGLATATDGVLDEIDGLLGDIDRELESARSGVDGWEWRAIEWIPPVGDNVRAARTAIEAAQWLVNDVAQPAVPLVMQGLRPQDGRFDIAAVRQLSGILTETVPLMQQRQQQLTEAAAKADLVGPVADGVSRLDNLLSEAVPALKDGAALLQLMPATLGGDGPRDYLLMFQGTSEARSLGGNPAVLLQVRAEEGAISIKGFANSSDFHSRAQPVMPLDPEAEQIFGDKIGRWFPDVTMPPDFPYSVKLVRAFWDETVGTDVDGVLSVDPTLLSYILASTGPITLSTGDVLTSENAVPLLLNEVYFRYEDPNAQNVFFAEAAGSVFTALTSGAGDPLGLAAALQRGAAEGRLLYAPTNPDEAALINGTRTAGSMPTDNLEDTVIGVYVNDNTGSKKSYFLKMSIDVASACDTSSEGGAYTAAVSLTSTLSPEVAATLPYYVTGPYFLPRVISTYVVLYGPVGGSLADIRIDDAEATVLSQGTHLGRPVVKVEVRNDGLSRHRIDYRFTSPTPDGGPISVWNTPMTGDTPVTVADECG